MGAGPFTELGVVMIVYVVEGAEPVDVELLTADEAHRVLTRLRGELVMAYNSVHAGSVRQLIAEVEGQVEWLDAEAAQVALEEAAVEHCADVWADYDQGVQA